MNCKNHPHIPAKRRCFHCKDSICSICQVRASSHIFCSDGCHDDYLKKHVSKKSSFKASKDNKGSLVSDTPSVDSAYSTEKGPIAIKNINLETFEAIQGVIDKTDRELKSYLRDLEMIFEASNTDSLSKLKNFISEQWQEFEKNLTTFKSSSEGSIKDLEQAQSNISKSIGLNSEFLEKFASYTKESSGRINEKLENIDSNISREIPTGFAKLFDALDNFSFSIDGNITNLKDILSNQTKTLNEGFDDVKESLTEDIKGNISDLKTGLTGRLNSIETSIDTGKELEKTMFNKNEEKIKDLLSNERKFIDEVLTEYYRKLTTNLNTNKEKVSQSISEGSSEIKDFLDYQRLELIKSVSKLNESLDAIFKGAEGKINSTGLDINKKLDEILKENSEIISENIGSFEDGIVELLENQKKAISDYFSSSEDEQRSILSKFETNIEDAFKINQGEFKKSLGSQSSLIEDNLTRTKADIKNELQSAADNIKMGGDNNASSISNYLSETTKDIRSTLDTTTDNIDKSYEEHREKIQKFLSDSLDNEKDFLKDQFIRNQSMLTETLKKIASEMNDSDLKNSEKIENSVKIRISEIDRIVNSLINETQHKLDNTSKTMERHNKASINEFIGKLLSSQEFFTQQFKSHLDKRESILVDKMAALIISNKSNMSEILENSKTDLDDRIKFIEKEMNKLLKTEIRNKMDVFNLNLSSILGEIKDNLKKKVMAIPSRFSLSPAMQTILIFVLALLIINPVIVYLNSKYLNKNFDGKIDKLAGIIDQIENKETAPIIGQKEKVKPVLAKPTLGIKNNYTSSRNRITLAGTSKFGDFAILTLNGRWKSIRFIKKQKFKFDNIVLSPGKNSLKVTAFDKEGFSSSSISKELFYKKASNKIYNLAYNVSRGDIRKPYVTLTFDGGSNARAAKEILNTLREKRITTTMFLTGEFIEKNPDLTKRIVKLGHEVGNHMYSHPHSLKDHGKRSQRTIISRENFEIELKRTQRLFEKVTGKKMIPYWRAPYGEINDEVLTWAKNTGYTHIGWTTKQGKSMDSLDWVEMEESKLYRSAEAIKNTILNFDGGIRGGANGSIILMHLGTNRQSDQPYSKLGEIIDGMRKKGYRFTKITSLMNSFKKTKVAKSP